MGTLSDSDGLQGILKALAREKVTVPWPGGPGKVTLAVREPLGALAGIVKVAVTVLPLRCTLLPLRVPSWAAVGARVTGGIMPPKIIVRDIEEPLAPVFGDTDVSVGPPGGTPPPPPPVAVPVAGSKAARAVWRTRKNSASPRFDVRSEPRSPTAAMLAPDEVHVLRSVDRSTEYVPPSSAFQTKVTSPPESIADWTTTGALVPPEK